MHAQRKEKAAPTTAQQVGQAVCGRCNGGLGRHFASLPMGGVETLFHREMYLDCHNQQLREERLREAKT